MVPGQGRTDRTAADLTEGLAAGCGLVWRPHRLYPTRLPCPWDSPGKNTGVGCHTRLSLGTRPYKTTVSIYLD